MPLVEEPIDFAASPPNHEHEIRVEHSHCATQRRQGHHLQMSPFNKRDSGLRGCGCIRHVTLAKRSTVAKRADDPSDTSVLHVPMIEGWPSLAITRRFALP
jgi:hypothetical protein